MVLRVESAPHPIPDDALGETVAAASKRQLNPLDLYDVRSLLSEEECMVQDSVARMVDEKVLPIIQEHFENHTFPRELVAENGFAVR